MKDKIQIIVLAVFFIIILIGIKEFLNYEENLNTQNNLSENIAVNNEIINNSNYENEEKNQIIEEDNNMEDVVLEVTEESFEKEVLKESKLVLIDFYADWCGPCQVLSPRVENVAKLNPDVKFVKINLDNAENLAIEYGVMSIPTLVVIKDGKEVKRSVGLISQSEIEKLIK